jgi:hypothetical protein
MATDALRKNGTWVALAVLVAVIGGLLYWQFRPWASDEDKSRLAGLRDQLTSFYQTHPPIPEWHILDIDVGRPGIVVTLDIPARSAELIQRRAAVYRLQAAGAICPEPGNPIYAELGEFDIEIHPQANGKPVLVEADCRNVRGLKQAPHA